MNKKEVMRKIIPNVRFALNNRMSLSDKFTDDKIARMSINNVWGSLPDQHVVENIFPNVNLGYGGDTTAFYGAGPTRLISCANYALRSTFTFENIKLFSGFFNGVSKEFSGLLNKIAEDLSENKQNVKFIGPEKVDVIEHAILINGYAPVAMGSIDLNSKGTYTEFLISNMKKGTLNYNADISVHLVRLFGSGGAFFPRKYSEEDMILYRSLATSSLYTPENGRARKIADNFEFLVKMNRTEFSEKANLYKKSIENASGTKLKSREYNIVTLYNQ